jgi:hypothetical protein
MVVLIKWQLFKTIKINKMVAKPMSLLVNEKYDIGVLLMLLKRSTKDG